MTRLDASLGVLEVGGDEVAARLSIGAREHRLSYDALELVA